MSDTKTTTGPATGTSAAAAEPAPTTPAGKKRAGLHTVKAGEQFVATDDRGGVVLRGEVTDRGVRLTTKGYRDLDAPVEFTADEAAGLLGDGHTVTVVD